MVAEMAKAKAVAVVQVVVASGGGDGSKCRRAEFRLFDIRLSLRHSALFDIRLFDIRLFDIRLFDTYEIQASKQQLKQKSMSASDPSLAAA